MCWPVMHWHQDNPLIYFLLLLVLLLPFTLKNNCTLFLCARLEAEPTIFKVPVHIALDGHSHPISKGPTRPLLH
jgi:hypothetical protein